jgi:hypothetical protein
MTELNVTALINRFSDDGDLDPMDLSGSRMEHGQNAGQITWNNCLELATDSANIDSDLNLLEIEIIKHSQDVRDHFAEYGAWSTEEINEWSDTELVAITLQEIAASYRELESNDFVNDDKVSGRLFQCDIEDHDQYGQWFLYLGM